MLHLTVNVDGRQGETNFYKYMKKIIGGLLLSVGIVLLLLSAGCAKAFFSGDYDGKYSEAAPSVADGVPGGPRGGEDGKEGGQGGYSSGIVTAGEWNDIVNWGFWANLLNNQDWAGYASFYKFYPRVFAYVELTDGSGAPVCGARAALVKGGGKVWEAVSDNTGHAALWTTLSEDTYKADPADYIIDIEGTEYKDFEFTTPNTGDVKVNKYTVSSKKTENAIDVAFIVDATGSMGDEIGFLKADLRDIIDLVGKQCTAKVRTGTVFYRDEGDEYVTKHSQFNADVKKTIEFIGEQRADGGGDWEEAVHKALEAGVQSLGWNASAKSRVAFLILDAPPHREDAILASCQKSVAQYAKMGIKIVPVSASGIDKGTEYLLRSFALGTNGTYVFITNHSGVGDGHIEATVGEYQVEKLRDLIARLIIAYAR